MVDDRATVCLRGARPLRLNRGESVTFGRSPRCDLCIGAAATGQVEDTGVSRRAGTLRYDEAGVTVTNTSASRALTVRPTVGQDRVVGSGEALTLARRPFAVIVHGQVFVHTIDVAVEVDLEIGLDGDDGRDALVRLLVESGTVTAVDLGLL